MTTLILTIDDDRIDDDQLGTALATLPEAATSSADVADASAVIQAVLDTLPAAAIEIHRNVRRPDWERGEPCPECGHETMSVMGVEEDLYESRDGEFRYVKKGDAIGPDLSVICPECMTHLVHVPYQRIAV